MKCEWCDALPDEKIHTLLHTYYVCAEHSADLAHHLHENGIWLEEIEAIRN